MFKWIKILIIRRLCIFKIYCLFTKRLLECTGSQKSMYLCSGIQKSSIMTLVQKPLQVF